jgi:hypothetical protein
MRVDSPLQDNVFKTSRNGPTRCLARVLLPSWPATTRFIPNEPAFVPTLRSAELAGLDAGQVLADAIGERDLAGVRDLAAVIDARLRYRLGALIPRPPGSWSVQVPEIAAPNAALTSPRSPPGCVVPRR